MKSTTALADTIDRSIFALCNSREERFLRDLMRQTPHLKELRFPEGTVILTAIEEITGGARGRALDPVPASLVYNLTVYAYYADVLTPEDRDGSGAMVLEVHAFLQQFIQTVAVAIQEGTFVRHLDEGVFIDAFQIPQWFYNEITRRDHMPPRHHTCCQPPTPHFSLLS